jgi:PIN domain nuclease of toxin-antitoxin system
VTARLLLDTHALIWALSNPRRLPAHVAASIRDAETDVYVSAASTWEIAIKAALRKIDANVADVVRAMRAVSFDELPVTIAHTVRLGTLPNHHRDPFDRLLVAQAVEERLTIVTHDPLIARYDVPRLWA